MILRRCRFLCGVLLGLLFFAPTAGAADRDKFKDQAVYSLFTTGVYKSALGDWAGAIEDFRQAQIFQPVSALILLKLAEASFEVSDFDAAEQYALQTLATDTTASKAYIVLASIALVRRDYDAMDFYLQKRLELKPDDIESRLKLGFVREQTGDMEGVVRAFSNFPANRQGAPAINFHRGVALTRLNRLEEARGAFEEALRINPGYQEAAENIAAITESLGDETAALAAWLDVLAINADNAVALGRKVALLVRLGRQTESIRDLERLIELQPERSDAFRRLLLQLSLQNNEVSIAARTMYEIARSLSSETAFLQAAVLAAQAKTETAVLIRSLESAFDSSSSGPIGILLARSYAMNGRETEAAIILEKLTESRPEEFEPLWLLALVYQELGRIDDALTAMLRVVKLDPANAEALNYVGYTWVEQGVHLDRAEEFIRRALTADPENPQYIDSLGWLFYQRGVYDLAKSYLEKAHFLLPEEPTILEHLGNVYVKLGRDAEAIIMYEKLLATGKAEHPEFLKENIRSLRHSQ